MSWSVMLARSTAIIVPATSVVLPVAKSVVAEAASSCVFWTWPSASLSTVANPAAGSTGAPGTAMGAIGVMGRGAAIDESGSIPSVRFPVPSAPSTSRPGWR
jgi:hypothetical protein